MSSNTNAQLLAELMDDMKDENAETGKYATCCGSRSCRAGNFRPDMKAAPNLNRDWGRFSFLTKISLSFRSADREPCRTSSRACHRICRPECH